MERFENPGASKGQTDLWSVPSGTASDSILCCFSVHSQSNGAEFLSGSKTDQTSRAGCLQTGPPSSFLIHYIPMFVKKNMYFFD